MGSLLERQLEVLVLVGVVKRGLGLLTGDLGGLFDVGLEALALLHAAFLLPGLLGIWHDARFAGATLSLGPSQAATVYEVAAGSLRWMRLDHVGIATPDAAGLTAQYTSLLGAPVVHEETFDGLRLVFLEVGSADLELLEPLEADGPVARFLDRRGPGLHHLAFATDDVAAALDAAQDLGVDRIDDRPRPGARGHTVGFVHPAGLGGVLVEFVER